MSEPVKARAGGRLPFPGFGRAAAAFALALLSFRDVAVDQRVDQRLIRHALL